jgi:hypothetical protein
MGMFNSSLWKKKYSRLAAEEGDGQVWLLARSQKPTWSLPKKEGRKKKEGEEKHG